MTLNPDPLALTFQILGLHVLTSVPCLHDAGDQTYSFMYARQILSQLSHQPTGEGEQARQQSLPHPTPTLCRPSRAVLYSHGASVGEGVAASGLWCKPEWGEVRWLSRAVVLKPQALEGTPVSVHRGVTVAKGATQL